MRVVVSNVFADDNRGGAAITAATVQQIRRVAPRAQIKLLAVPGSTPEPVSVSHRHTLREIPAIEVLPAPFVTAGRFGGLRAVARSLGALLWRGRHAQGRPALSELAGADIIVSKGGYVFVDRDGIRGLMSLWLTAFPIIFGIRYRIPTVIYSSTIGPFDSWLSRALNGFILRRAHLLLPRDPRSCAHAVALGVPRSRICQIPDSVLRMNPPSPQHVASLVERIGLPSKRYAVVTIRRAAAPEQHQRFVARLWRVLRPLLDDGTIDNVAAVVQVDGTVTSDAVATQEFVGLAADTRVTLVQQDLSPKDLIALYGGARFVVGCRLHSTLFAVVARSPALAFSLDGMKTEGIFESLRLRDWVFDYPHFDKADLRKALSEINDDYAAAQDRVEKGVQGLQDAFAVADQALARIFHQPVKSE